MFKFNIIVALVLAVLALAMAQKGRVRAACTSKVTISTINSGATLSIVSLGNNTVWAQDSDGYVYWALKSGYTVASNWKQVWFESTRLDSSYFIDVGTNDDVCIIDAQVAETIQCYINPGIASYNPTTTATFCPWTTMAAPASSYLFNTIKISGVINGGIVMVDGGGNTFQYQNPTTGFSQIGNPSITGNPNVVMATIALDGSIFAIAAAPETRMFKFAGSGTWTAKATRSLSFVSSGIDVNDLVGSSVITGTSNGIVDYTYSASGPGTWAQLSTSGANSVTTMNGVVLATLGTKVIYSC